jgi:hypothetical protein
LVDTEAMRFRTTILQSGKTATGIRVPDEVMTALGQGKRPPVRVTINDYTYRTTVATMAGVPMVPVSKAVREQARVEGGEEVDIDIDLDTEPREVVLPADVVVALDADPQARRCYDGLSYSHRSAYVLWIESAKKDETRQRRIAEAVEMLRQGRKQR